MSGVRPESPAGALTSACPLFTRKRTVAMEPAKTCMHTCAEDRAHLAHSGCITAPFSLSRKALDAEQGMLQVLA